MPQLNLEASKNGAAFYLGVSIMSFTLYWGLHWGFPVMGKDHSLTEPLLASMN